MKLFLKASLNLILFPVFLIGIFIPKSKNIWIFGSWFGNLYMDNSRYLYEHISENEKKITPIWLTRNKIILKKIRQEGKKCYTINSLLGFYYTARAGVIIVSQGIVDINKYGLSRQIKVLLWHGSPIKKIAFDDNINAHPYNEMVFNFGIKFWDYLFPFEKNDWDLITASSDEVKEKFISAFKSNSECVKITGYPRYDVIHKKVNNIVDELPEIIKEKKIIFYAPTFRDKNPNFNYFNGLDEKKLNQLMKINNLYFVIKLHPSVNNSFNFKYNNIIIIQNEDCDTNILLKQTEILLTDYSSIFIDYLLLNKPIIFTPFDLKNYIQTNRKLYYDYNLITPGEICHSWNKVLKEINNILSGGDKFLIERSNIKQKFHKFIDTENCLRIINRIKELNG